MFDFMCICDVKMSLQENFCWDFLAGLVFNDLGVCYLHRWQHCYCRALAGGCC